ADSQTVQIPLKVISTYPKNYATGCSRTATIYLKFSGNIKASTYWSKIYVKNKYGNKVSISKSIYGNYLYIKTYKRASYSYYTVYIPYSAVKDYANNNLAKYYTFMFKTGKY
ncbi:Ig-like domain-containing protein, partial [Methanobacterium sp.]|uniref:Ig-like domain-containing protein n=1 Tax=Methanobacterium sp. TaxID=2164 RepID=UPI003C73D89B